MIKKNVGNTDRFVRMALSVVLGVVYMSRVLPRSVENVALILGTILIITSLTGTCPVYSLLGINTCKSPLKKHKGTNS